MADLYKRAQAAALASIANWASNGRDTNGKRVFTHGSRRWSVDLETGAWQRTDTGDRGFDLIECYAAVAGIAALPEAARDALTTYDLGYFPLADDVFTPPDRGGDYWAGFVQVRDGLLDQPPLSTEWYERQGLDVTGAWQFYRRATGCCCAALLELSDGTTRQLSLWSDGKETRWRVRPLRGRCPAYVSGRPAQGVPYLIVDSPRIADAVSEALAGAYAVYAPMPDRLGHTDWEWVGREDGYYWPAHRLNAEDGLRRLEAQGLSPALVAAPLGTPIGWTPADAVREWEGTRVAEYIAAATREERSLEDQLPFRIVGVNGGSVWFYPEESRLLMCYRRSGLGRQQLMTLMDRRRWLELFPRADGVNVDWDAATDLVLRRAADAPIYDRGLIRGSGVWLDGDAVVLNSGEGLVVDGEEAPLFNRRSRYVYERSRRVRFGEAEPMTAAESTGLLDVVRGLAFTLPEQALALAGWLTLAPFCGALEWRPHVWVTGGHGSGKSWIMDHIVYPVVGAFSVSGFGSSTAAGLRQAMGSNALPVIYDEAEADEQRQHDKIEEVLTLARQCSSGGENAPAILMGTQDGSGMEYKASAMFLLSSITANISQNADLSRWTVLTLETPRDDQREQRRQAFEEIERAADVLTGEWAAAYHSRTLRLLPQFARAIRTFRVLVADRTGTQRRGDQLGTLLAGAAMIGRETAPTAAEAAEWLRGLDVMALDTTREAKTDEEVCLEHLMTTVLSFEGSNERRSMTIATALQYYYECQIPGERLEWEFDDVRVGPRVVSRVLQEHGIKPLDQLQYREIRLAIGHRALREALEATPWRNTWASLLKRLPYARVGREPETFRGTRSHYIALDTDSVIDVVPF